MPSRSIEREEHSSRTFGQWVTAFASYTLAYNHQSSLPHKKGENECSTG